MGQDTESKSGFHNLLILPLVADKRLRDSSYILFHSVFYLSLDDFDRFLLDPRHWQSSTKRFSLHLP